jgi:Uma2 family endonuclease
MSTLAPPRPKAAVAYTECDGLPMADTTKQFRWIVTIQGGVDAVFREDANVFVAGNLFWYPVEGASDISVAPDIFVVFGRPKDDRGSYLQWLEHNIAPQVVFEVHSPGNRAGQLLHKFKFYERYGVEEYYLYDPENGDLSGWIRENGELKEIPQMTGWTSPRLKVRFEMVDGKLRLYGPEGRFATYVELVEQREQERGAREQAEQQARSAQQRAERLAAQLKALGVEPEA